MNAITEQYINKCIKKSGNIITEHAFNQKIQSFRKLNGNKHKLQIYKPKFIGQASKDSKPTVIEATNHLYAKLIKHKAINHHKQVINNDTLHKILTNKSLLLHKNSAIVCASLSLLNKFVTHLKYTHNVTPLLTDILHQNKSKMVRRYAHKLSSQITLSSQSPSHSPHITQNLGNAIMSAITPNVSYSNEENADTSSSSFDEDNALHVDSDSSLDYDQSSSTELDNANEYGNKYVYPWSSDSEDSYADLNEYQTLHKLKDIIGQRAQALNNNNEAKQAAKVAAEEKEEQYNYNQDENIIFPRRNGKYLTMIIVKKYQCDKQGNVADDGIDELSLDDLSDVFLEKVGHLPHNIAQMLAFCKHNDFEFGYKEISKWWTNRPNPKEKPVQKPVNV